MFKDYYQILEITQSATLEEIKEAYRIASKKWHPDLNHGIDTTQMMQDINEAYAILKDEMKRTRYDAEYVIFNEKKYSYKQTAETHSSGNSWSYDYDVKDENLKDDINTARQYAKDLVDEFLSSLRENSMKAAKGVWDGAKGYVYVAIVFSVIGFIITLCSNIPHETNVTAIKSQITNESTSKGENQLKPKSQFEIPKDWTEYEIDGAFSISVPPTIELRYENDNYTKQLNDLHLNINKDVVIFQQKNLSKGGNDDHYCRVIFQHFIGNKGDFLRANEHEILDFEWQQSLTEMVNNELYGQQTLLKEPTLKWTEANENIKAIAVNYRRSGNKNHTTNVTIYLLQNYDEMVEMIVSYREQEKDMWIPDLENIIKTFKWNTNK